MELEEKLEIAEQERTKIYKLIENLQKKIFIKNKPNLEKKYLDKCFKYQNSYSCSTEDKKWWFYARITKIIGENSFEAETFQDDKIGKIEFVKDHYFYLGNEYIPITKKEYLSERKKLIKKL